MSSAQELKQRFRKPEPIIVTIPGTDLTIECRRPDLMSMVMSGLMAWPALERVRALAQARSTEGATDAAPAVIDNRPLPTLVDRAQAVGTMLDEWVCLAAVSPRVVLTEYDQTDESIWVGDIPYEGRQAVFSATFRRPSTAVADFRHDEPRGVVSGQDGETVRDETIVAAGDDQPDGGARP